MVTIDTVSAVDKTEEKSYRFYESVETHHALSSLEKNVEILRV